MNSSQQQKEQVVYGTRAIIEAVHSGKEFERLFVQKNINNELSSELLSLLKKHDISYSRVPIEKLNSITRKNHQGVIGIISPIIYASLDNIISTAYEAGKSPFILVLDRITDVRNFGAICRTAECAGVQGIVVPDKGSAQISSDAIKTSAGALNHISVCRVKNLESTIKFLQDNGLFVLACTEKTDTGVYTFDLNRPLAIILGSEENGVSNEYLRKADALGRIPMHGKISSLNVSVAAGVLMYEVVRQRGL
jgi:23S rRNA (guanosine2251-2'-O)-methyltransferase